MFTLWLFLCVPRGVLFLSLMGKKKKSNSVLCFGEMCLMSLLVFPTLKLQRVKQLWFAFCLFGFFSWYCFFQIEFGCLALDSFLSCTWPLDWDGWLYISQSSQDSIVLLPDVSLFLAGKGEPDWKGLFFWSSLLLTWCLDTIFLSNVRFVRAGFWEV